MKQLSSTEAEGWEDMLEIGRGTRCRTQGRRIQDAASNSKKRKTGEAAADLEPARANVLVRNAVTCKVQDWPQKKRREPGPANRAGGGARGDMEGNDHVR